jgi:hypothetical protein
MLYLDLGHIGYRDVPTEALKVIRAAGGAAGDREHVGSGADPVHATA